MGETKLESGLNQKKLRDAGSFLCILLGSVIIAVNINTFVEQGNLVPGGFKACRN